MLAHLVNQFTVLVGQTALVFLFMLLVFNISCNGSLPLAIFITLVQGLCGMCYGIYIIMQIYKTKLWIFKILNILFVFLLFRSGGVKSL